MKKHRRPVACPVCGRRIRITVLGVCSLTCREVQMLEEKIRRNREEMIAMGRH